VDHAQRAQRLDPRELARVQGMEGRVALARGGELQRPLAAVAREHHPQVRDRRAHAAVFEVVERYAAQLHRGGGKLVLSGVSDLLYSQLERTGLLNELGPDNVIRAIVRPGAAMRRAVAEAEVWLSATDPAAGDGGRAH
jgi:hypothetical protein